MKKIIVIMLACVIGMSVFCGEPADRINSDKVKVGLIFIPNVQFAPFYVAMYNKYYAEEGLDVSFEFSNPADAIQFAGIEKFDFIIGDGEQVIIARDKGLPVKYVMSIYSKYPVAIAALDEKNITKPADLMGKTVGVPEYSGASYVGFKALLNETQIKESDLNLIAIGYTQAAALTQGRVDAAVVYINNAPIQLRDAGESIRLIRINEYVSLISAGIITNDNMIENKPDIVRKFTRATRRGIEFVKSSPRKSLDICFNYISEGKESRRLQYKVLIESIKLYENDYSQREGTGLSDPRDWEKTQDILYDLRLVKEKRSIDSFYSNNFLINKQ